ncbi:MAG: sigma-70 family RNA polymerase sigma factor [Jatrophihabitantaceae bacterium]
MVPDLRGEDAFTEWVAPHWAAMTHLASRLCGRPIGEDVLQEALTTAWRKRAQFDPQRGSARNRLLALTADQARKAHRRSTRRAESQLIDLPITSPAANRDIDIDHAIRRLSDRQKLAIDLYYFLGLPVADVARVMRCAEGTVKSTLSDARERLRHDLGEDFE